eukprot:Blabericola_migrator_1__13021@NODE_871_length_6203_cov_215_911832_g224_i2_p4_GENE_NODE_871_length_6203_cov_215_911832_g224_i2NODE_871_length_6203_cov_215_911832_g224_i2_p4_ORF_typecomplete_len228_score57_22tRNAsynt_1c_C/PF03950_18/6_4e50tRNAsynt_1c_C/PF03950_18/2_1e03_NODE_871_length_6203_cov_215_911832_g224_i253426025
MGERDMPFSRVLYIDRSDFMENPTPKYFRLSPTNGVRLRYGYYISYEEAVKNEAGEIIELKCRYDPATKGGAAPASGKKVKGVIHWVSEIGSIEVEVRLYETLFVKADPDEVSSPDQTWLDNLNPNSLRVKSNARMEKSLKGSTVLDTYQFERVGFFACDEDTTPERPVFNLTVGLVDTFAAQSDQASKEAQAKAEAKLARDKAARERQLKKEAKAAKEAAKVAGKA